MKRIHHISGIIITIFIGLHLLNHSISVLSIADHIQFMDKCRVFYRNTMIETILLGAILVQIVSGIQLFFSKKSTVIGSFEKLQIWTGLYLVFFFVIHVGAILMGRYILELDTNIYFGIAGLNTFPFNIFFIPYYALAILSFFGHIASIHFQKMNNNVFGLTVEQQSKLIVCKGIVLACIILYGLTNGFQGVEIPVEYHVLIGK